MDFQNFPKIETMNTFNLQHYKSDNRTFYNEWAVMEMLDGDHLAIYANAKEQKVKAACRSRFLEDKDTYSIWKDTITYNKKWLLEVSSSLGKPIIVYGKILGGKYGKERLQKEAPVHTVCEYMPLKDFFIHDIRLPEGFISVKELQTLGSRLLLNIAPILYIGRFHQASAFPENNLSVVPFMHCLKPSFTNEMKGIVVRPVFDLKIDGNRMILKKLNRKYIGKKDEARVLTPITKSLMDIAEHMEFEATSKSMLDIAINHKGAFEDYEIPKLAGQYVAYILDHVNYIKYNLLFKVQQRLVHKELNRLAIIKINKLVFGEEQVA